MNNGYKLGFTIKQLHGAFESNRNNFFRQYNVTGSQMDILEYLDAKTNKMATVAEIQTYLNVSYATVSGIVSRLEEKTFVDKMKGVSDRRQTNVSISDNKEVKDLLKLQHVYLESMDQKVTEDFTESEVDTLILLLERLLSNSEGT